jgi:hypothetical protein
MNWLCHELSKAHELLLCNMNWLRHEESEIQASLDEITE